MAKEELGKLSPEQLKMLGKVLSEAKSLTNQQAEIIEKVLAGEEDIGKLRIAYLEQYFDKYSSKLDLIARKYSTLNDTFLVLDNKLNENYKALSSDIGKLANRLEKVSKLANKVSGGGSSTTANNKELSNITKEITNIATILKNGVTLNKAQHQALLTRTAELLGNAVAANAVSPASTVQYSNDTSDSSDSYKSFQESVRSAFTLIETLYDRSIPTNTYNYTGTAGQDLTAATAEPPSVPPASPPSPPVEPPILPPLPITDSSSDDTADTTEGSSEVVLSGLKKDVQDFLDFLDGIAKDGIAVYTQESKIIARQQEQRTERIEAWAKTQEAIEQTMVDLAIAKQLAIEEIEQRSIETRLARLKDATDAELKAQEQANKVAMQLARTQNKRGVSDKEAGEMRARKINAEADTAAYLELEKQIADYRAKLDLEARAKNNGKLTARQAAENEKLVRKEFASREKALLKEIKAKQLNEEKLARLKIDNPRLAQAHEKQLAEYKAEQEYRLRKKLGRDLTNEELKALDKQAEREFELNEDNLARIEKLREKHAKRDQKDEEKARRKNGDQAVEAAATGPLTKENSLFSRIEELATIAAKAGEDGGVGKTIGAGLVVATKALSSLVKQLENTVDKIGSYKGDIDTRLQGSKNKTSSGSYWDQLTKDMMSVGAVTPYFKQEKFAENIKSLVDQGIAFDLKQRAFLMTIQEKIANTFNVADGTLLRLIRLQQEDSTAGRLGMESALNSFLNEMYENTEYLKSVAEGVRSSLQEMEALMSGAAATEVEFQVQKWMGSLYSVGMSQEAVTAISTALGQIASGQVDALTNGGAGNLLVMAANDAGIPIADILAGGLEAEETNRLLQATVNYLAEIAEASEGNNVVQQQLANVFGVKASDLRAATNLAEPNSTSDIFGYNKTYDNMLYQLDAMVATMGKRVSIGEKMSNIWDNAQYTIASGMANSPVAYLTYKMASLLEAATGGIALPFISVHGYGVDLETTVADLMRVASMSKGIMGSIGSMISGLSASFDGQAMLKKMGISSGSGLEVNHRGSGISSTGLDGSLANSRSSTSGSGYVGNSSSSDVKNATMQEATDSKKQQMIEAKEEEPVNNVAAINASVVKIYELLDNVVKGNQTLRVRVDSFGLTGTSSSNSLINQSTTNDLLANSSSNKENSVPGTSVDNGNDFSSGASGTVGSGGNLTSNSGSVNLGGWTIL